MPYPNTPGFARNSATSRLAAERLTSREETQGLIIKFLTANPEGATADEVKPFIDAALDREVDRGTISARFAEMKEAGLIVETAQQRLTKRGRPATVCVLAQNYKSDVPPSRRRPRHVAAEDKRYDANCELAVMFARLANAAPDKSGFVRVEITPMELQHVKKLMAVAGLQ